MCPNKPIKANFNYLKTLISLYCSRYCHSLLHSLKEIWGLYKTACSLCVVPTARECATSKIWRGQDNASSFSKFLYILFLVIFLKFLTLFFLNQNFWQKSLFQRRGIGLKQSLIALKFLLMIIFQSMSSTRSYNEF